MTNEELRIKVADAMGNEIGWGEILTIEPDHNGEPNIVDHRPIPNYSEDLNACAEFEKTLKTNERAKRSLDQSVLQWFNRNI